ncbi:MAG TPA: hypothetical protein VIW67_15635 [Terriglobales bacterium]
MLVGFCLVLAGMYLYMLQITEGGKLAVFLAAMGLVYFSIGVILSLIHDQHMTKRTRADDNE